MLPADMHHTDMPLGPGVQGKLDRVGGEGEPEEAVALAGAPQPGTSLPGTFSLCVPARGWHTWPPRLVLASPAETAMPVALKGGL